MANNAEWEKAARAYLAKREANPDDNSIDLILEGFSLLSDENKAEVIKYMESLVNQHE